MRLWTARAAAAGAVGVALYLTLSPHPAGAEMLPDWVGHLGIFAGVGVSFALLHRVSVWPPSRLWLLGVTVVFLGAATEAGQSFTGRDPDVVDLAFDLAGGLVAIAVAHRLLRGAVRPLRG